MTSGNVAHWFGTLPSGWRSLPIGRVFAERKQIVSDSDFEALSVTKSGVVPQLENAAKSDNNDSRKLVRTGDFVINSRSDRKGSSGISDRDGSVSVVYIVLEPEPEIDGRYAHYLLRSTAFQEEFYRWGSGIVADLWSTRFSAMSKILLPLPPLEEQRAIADYLDRETAQIDELVAKNRRLTETIICRMKGETRDLLSGVDLPGVVVDSGLWFPYLPTGWRSVPIRHLGKTGSGSGFPVELQGVSGQEFEFFKVKHLASIDLNGFLPNSDDTISDETRQLIRATSFPVNSIVYAKVGAALMLGRFGLLPRAGCIDNNMSALIVDEEFFDPKFIRLQLEQMDMAYLVNPGAVPSMSDKNFSAMKLPIPNRAMQASIVAEVDGKLEKYRRLLEETNKTIELMLERRAALITAAVTGQIDVSQGRAT